MDKLGSTLHGKDPYYSNKRLSDSEFVVKHYAGEVIYETEGFLEKNRDTIHNDLKDLLSHCGNAPMLKMFTDTALVPPPAAVPGNSKAAPTVTMQVGLGLVNF